MQMTPSLDGPLFVLGMGRSGTTVLRLMLTAHPQLCIPPESMFFVALEPKYGHLSDLSDLIDLFITDLCEVKSFSDWELDLTLLRQNLSQYQPLDYATAIATVYQTYLQQVDPEALFWGDKNPAYTYQVERIREYFPTAKLLLIIRDVRGTYGSLKRTEKSFKQWRGSCRANVLSVTRQWNYVINLAKRHQNDPNFQTVLYEQLVDNPQQELNQICTWLGIEFNDSMLRYYEKNSKQRLVPSGEQGWNAKTYQPITRGRVDSWKQELSQGELEALEALNYRHLNELGYACVTSSTRYRALVKAMPDYAQHIYQRLMQVTVSTAKKMRMTLAQPRIPKATTL